MATNTEARKARDRKLRAKYRKKTVTAAVIALVIGLVLGFVLCAVSVSHPGPISRMLGVGPVDDSIVMTPKSGDADAGFDAADEEPDAFGDEEELDAFAGDEEDDAFGEEPDAFGEEGDVADAFGDEEEDPDALAGEEEPSAFNEEDDVAGAFGDEEEGEAVEQEPTPEPTPEATATPEPTPEPSTAPQIVPFGQTLAMQTEINADGTPRRSAGATAFETLNFSLKIDAHRNPTYFQSQYGTQYKLNGDEAVVQFDLTLNGYMGSQQIVPQNALEITLMGATPDVINEGYQLMDAEISGKADVSITPNTVTTLYKRYSYAPATGDMRYLVVTTYVGGVPTSYWFDIGASQATANVVAQGATGSIDGVNDDAVTPVTGLTIGSEGEEVSRLQRALIAKGLLQGSPDGKFGSYTADAVKTMQGRYNMEQTGVADSAFLERLYSDQ